MPKRIPWVQTLISILGSVILSFGLYNIHSVSGVTEGGILGLTLLLDHWWDISPSISGLIFNGLCYLIGFKMLGRSFVYYSIVSSLGFSLSYGIFELSFPPLFPQLYDMPLLAAVLGGLFVGVGAGLCVRVGGAPGGDDALAMGLSKLFHCDIRIIYLMSDLSVLALSLTYVPLRRIIYSLLTVMISGQIIGVITHIGRKKINPKP